jgi:hypothetical protein
MHLLLNDNDNLIDGLPREGKKKRKSIDESLK